MVEAVGLDTISNDPENAREHPSLNIEAIAASLKRFGQRKPIVVRRGRVVAGNGTLEAARSLGWRLIEIVRADDLTEEEARAYALADNRTTDMSRWGEGLTRAWDRLPVDLKQYTGLTDKAVEAARKASEARASGLAPAVFSATPEQAEVIREAINRLRRSEGDEGMTDGRCLELIAADYLSGGGF